MQTMKHAENGNALWFILLAIVLLGALTLAVTRTSDTTEQSGDVERARIGSSEIMRYAKGVEQAVTQMRLRGIAENDISFETAALTGYANANCTTSACLIFDSAGGGLTYRDPGSNINDSTDWIFTAHNDVTGVGTTAPDLIMILPNIGDGACKQVNRMLGISTPAADNTVDFTPFTGSFTNAQSIDGMGGAKAGCQDNSGATYNKFFYQVLIAR